MALPAVAAKLAASLLANTKEGKNAIKGVMIAVASPFILIAVIVCSLFSAGNSHNDDIVGLVFGGGELSSQYPAEYAQEIVAIQEKFEEIEDVLEELEADHLDEIQIKSYFFAIYFGESASVDVADFVNHFMIATEVPENGSATVTDMGKVYASIKEQTGHDVTEDQKQNAIENYYRGK